MFIVFFRAEISFHTLSRDNILRLSWHFVLFVRNLKLLISIEKRETKSFIVFFVLLKKKKNKLIKNKQITLKIAPFGKKDLRMTKWKARKIFQPFA